MKLDMEKLKLWLNEVWDSPPTCPICQNEEWLWMEKIWELTEFRSNDKVLPVVASMCNICGHTIFFNAVVLELVKGNKE